MLGRVTQRRLRSPNASDTRTRNLHVCHSELQQDFSCAIFLHSRASFLHKIEHILFDVLVQEIYIKNLMQVSCTSFLHVYHQHNSEAHNLLQWEHRGPVCGFAEATRWLASCFSQALIQSLVKLLKPSSHKTVYIYKQMKQIQTTFCKSVTTRSVWHTVQLDLAKCSGIQCSW